MSLIGVKNEQNPAVFVQVRYRERDEIRCLRLPTSAAYVQIMHIPGANNAQKMSQIGAGFTHHHPVDFDQFNRLDFDTVVTSGQPSLF